MPMNPQKHTIFSTFAHKTSAAIGSYRAFFLAAAFVVAWLFAGPFMHFSTDWQFIITCATGTVTFFMVILLQHSQNHATKALHLKLDELIRATKKARNSLVELEQMPEQQLDDLKDEFKVIRDVAVRQEEIRAEEAAPTEVVNEEKETEKVKEPAL